MGNADFLNGFPRWHSGKESTCWLKKCRFDPWVRKIPWWRKWQPITVFLPGNFHRERSLSGYSPWGHKDLDTTERLSHTHGSRLYLWPLPQGKKQTTKQTSVCRLRQRWRLSLQVFFFSSFYWIIFSLWDNFLFILIQSPKDHLLFECWNLTQYIIAEEKAMATHSSTLAWKIPWTEEPGRLQSMGSLRVGYDWASSLSLFTFMHWRRKWQPTPVFLPGESQGRGNLVGCCLWGCTELDTTEAT